MTQPALEDFTVGWICARQEEYEAGCRMLDEEFDHLEAENADDYNTYVFGRIGKHYVIIGCLPAGRYGTYSTAVVARDMARSFPRLKCALMVGIGGGAPTVKDIRLGDVVVSQPHGTLGGVVQYDFGKRLPGGSFQRIGQLNSPPGFLFAVLPEIRRRHNDPRKPDNLSKHLKLMDDLPGYKRPALDRLYLPDYEHQGGATCTNCGEDGLQERPDRLSTNRPFEVHYGTIASANAVMKNAKEKDQLARDEEFNALCFEKEAAGLMNNFHCLVIRGICDYSDSHKNDDWHNYAALTAAAYARELLHVLKPRKVQEAPAWAGEMIEELSDEEDRILTWLSPTNYGSQQTAYIEKREPGTGEWFLESKEYLEWLTARKKILLGTGIPGAGKTIMASIVISDLNSRFRHCQNVSIAYVFCEYRQDNHQTARDLLASVLRQLTACLPGVPEIIKSLYMEHKPHGSLPSREQISNTLQYVVKMCEKTFIVVDALDELAANDCRNNFLKELFTVADSGANLFATSRPLPEVTTIFPTHTVLRIQASVEDIERYLERRIRALRPFKHGTDEQIQAFVKERLTRAVEGMFLLAELSIESLQGSLTVHDVLDGVNTILRQNDGYIGYTGRILEDAYNTTMERIDRQTPNVRAFALRALAWVCFAKTSLTASQLEEALGIRFDKGKLDRRDVPEIGNIISVCAGLVTVDQQDRFVQLANRATREYLESKRETLFSDAQSYITSSCVTYLSFSTFNQTCKSDHEFQQRRNANPLYDYCEKYWSQHVLEAFGS